MRYRLIALDLDHTLLGPDGQISPANRAAVAAARAAGCEVVLVTARAWRSVRAFVDELGLTLPAICVTGAAAYAADGQAQWEQMLDPESLDRLVAVADEQGVCMRVYHRSGKVLLSSLADDYGSEPGYVPREPLTSPLRPHLTADDPILQVAYFGRRATRAALAALSSMPQAVGTPYDFDSPTERILVMNAAATKGSGLARLCTELSISREAVIAMGDSEPDRSMIEWAGVGVAMGWGQESLRAAADLITPVNEPDGVAWAIRTLLGIEVEPHAAR